MSRLAWNEIGKKLYETGVSQGVLYPQNASGTYPLGVAWDGLIGVTESPSGAEATPVYASNTKYLNIMGTEEYGMTIEAYTYPEEFAECDGSAEIAEGVEIGQQNRKPFGFSYRTEIGNDTTGVGYGYKIHLVYGCQATPSEKAYQTINETPEAITFSYEVSTTPVNVTGFKPTACLTINSTKVPEAKMKALEDVLYGTASPESVARLPLPDEVVSLVGTVAG